MSIEGELTLFESKMKKLREQDITNTTAIVIRAGFETNEKIDLKKTDKTEMAAVNKLKLSELNLLAECKHQATKQTATSIQADGGIKEAIALKQYDLAVTNADAVEL
ncbi:hypothetical protein scyTo_0008479 [Scyliorhinus torazame]|uniref:Uncharacterized protein n=1 Tax=Scyliorhinus torazame TaxID=75743 RepID=A0A401PA11_SCYTO|nr:hypothetical protein [Scyliorhinus torazame]